MKPSLWNNEKAQQHDPETFKNRGTTPLWGLKLRITIHTERQLVAEGGPLSTTRGVKGVILVTVSLLFRWHEANSRWENNQPCNAHILNGPSSTHTTPRPTDMDNPHNHGHQTKQLEKQSKTQILSQFKLSRALPKCKTTHTDHSLSRTSIFLLRHQCFASSDSSQPILDLQCEYTHTILSS